MMKMPIRAHGIREQEIGDERYLFTADDQSLAVLNATAAAIWHLCDGTHTPAMITAALAATYPDISTLEQDVASCLSDFHARGLLAWDNE